MWCVRVKRELSTEFVERYERTDTVKCAGVVEWQTRRTQNPMLETTCGFKSHHQHQCASGFARGFFCFCGSESGSVRVVWVEYSQGACSCFPKVRGRHRCKGVRKQIEWDSLFLIVFFTKIKLVKSDF